MRNSNSWKYKDKQITELSRTQQQTHDFLDEDEEDGEQDYTSEDSYFDSFQPKQKPTIVRFSNRSFADCVDSAQVAGKRIGISYELDLISEIDRKIKEHFGNVLHAVEGLSARVTQLETRMRQVENSVDDLKESIGYDHGRTDRKLWEVQKILREVQGCIKDLRDRQEIVEAQVQLAKLRLPKSDLQWKEQNIASKADSNQEASSFVPQESHQLLPNQVACPQQPAPVSSNTPQSLHNQSSLQSPVVTAPQFPNQMPQNIGPSIPQFQSYSPLPVLTPETTHLKHHMPSAQQSQQPPSALYEPNQPIPPVTTHQQYLMTSAQQTQPQPQPRPRPPPPALHQPYQQTSNLPTISQSAQLPQLQSPANTFYFQAHLPSSHQPEEVPYLSSESIQKSSQPPGGFPPARKFDVRPTQQRYDQPSRRPYFELHSAYSQPPEHSSPSNLYPNNASPFGSSSSNMKSLRPASSASFPGGVSSSSQLPTAKILPHALPTASIVDGGSASSGNANRFPVDDVVENVVAMGFRRDLVRATVKTLTENKQSVDLNVVLDKLMNSR